MAFETYGTSQNEGRKKESTVDWDALNQYVVETAKLQQRETLIGYVAGIVDLGTQEQEDAEVEFKGTADDEVKEIKKRPDTYFKDGKNEKGKDVRLKCFPQKPVQCVTLAIDFPEIMLNKGQFFGDEEAEEMPLRLWYGGQFYTQGAGMVVGRPIPLRVSNIAEEGAKKPVWSLKPNHTLYKQAVGAKLIQPGDVFVPDDIDKLLGQWLQFEAQVFFKESRGKQYYTEYVKYVSGLGRGQKAGELVTSPFLIQFNQKNDEEALKNLRSHVINTIRQASNYEGSMIQKQLDDVRPKQQEQAENKEDAPAPQEAPTPAGKPERKPRSTPAPAAENQGDDEEAPF